MRRKNLHRLIVTERDEDLNTPLSVVVVLAKLDLAEKSEGCRERSASRSLHSEEVLTHHRKPP